jgi:hypothetical protein
MTQNNSNNNNDKNNNITDNNFLSPPAPSANNNNTNSSSKNTNETVRMIPLKNYKNTQVNNIINNYSISGLFQSAILLNPFP